MDPGLSISQLRKHLGVSTGTLTDWLRGITPPEWTSRPNAKDDLRREAVELRKKGWSVNDLAMKLDVAKSTAYSWVKHLPLDPDAERAREKKAHSDLMLAARWDEYRVDRDRRQSDVWAGVVGEVGEITDRDLLLGGALVYMCEGAKSKPWRRLDRLTFINNDPRLHCLFLRFLQGQGREVDSLRYRVQIHESSDAEVAGDWWAERLGLPRELFQRPTIKRHNPSTKRANTGDDYHGCLVISVPQSRELYWRVEGVMEAFDARR